MLDICLRYRKYATNWCHGFPLLLANKGDLDIYVTYNSFALKHPFDCWCKTIVSALENRRAPTMPSHLIQETALNNQ